MSDLPVTQNDIAQTLSRLLLDVSTGKRIEKTRVEQQIEISDAICRRLQVRINTMKVYIDAKRHGVDFAAAMKEIREVDNEARADVGDLEIE